MKTKSILLLLTIFSYFSCSNDQDSIFSGPTNEFQSSVFVTIKDPAGIPIKGAQITLGDVSGITDESGTYFFTQAMLTGDDYLQVEKVGYFKGSRRFYSQESNTQFLQITLLPHKEITSFKSNYAATMAVDQKTKLIFPNNSVTRQDGSPYSGDVHVMASLIYGDDPQLSTKMPGALIGQDASGNEVALGSFGMIAVEIQADNGEILKIAEGKTVEIQLGVPDNQLGQAPAFIPLWYFDEDKGIWIAEGQAELQGNVYVAHVSHFSYWNCDILLELVNWEASYVGEDGRPAQNIEVCLTIKSINDQRCSRTDASGIVYGPIPANEEYIVCIKNECGSILTTYEFGPFSDDIKMEAKKLNNLHDYATISGSALQCDGLPIKSGFVRVHTPKNNFIFPISGNEGSFEGGYTYCTGEVATLYVYDIPNDLVSHPQAYNFERNLNVGNIKACNQLEEFIRYTIKGFSPEYFYYLPALTTFGADYTEIESLDSIGVKGRFGFVFKGRTVGQFSANGAHGNQINIPNGQSAYVTSMTVNVTEFGPEGEFIRGDFFGKINKGSNGAGGSGPSDFNGSFAVKNE